MMERIAREPTRIETMLTRRVPVVVMVVSTALMLGVWGQGSLAQAAQDDEKDRSDGASESVTLELEGTEGVPFSGSCSVGEDRRKISGQVPESFEFDVEEGRLSCEIHKRDGHDNAVLEVALSGEGSRSVQRIEGGEGTVKLAYKGGAVSSSMSSFSSKQTDSGDERSSSATDESAREDDTGSLADRIQRMVDEILERAIP